MVNWVEEVVTSDVRIVCHFSSAVPIVRSPLTYLVEKNGEADRGPFGTFNAAMKVAIELATGADAQRLAA